MGNVVPIAIMYNIHKNQEKKNENEKKNKNQEKKRTKTTQSSTYESVSLIDGDDEKV
jgi:hypothetical protein